MNTKTGQVMMASLVLILTCAWTVALLSASPGDTACGELAGVFDKTVVYTRESALAGLNFVPTGEPVLINLDVRRYSQNDPAWKDQEMGGTCTVPRTIGAKGCALTSVCMVFRYYGATSKNPSQMNACMGSYACPLMMDIAASSCDENKADWYGSIDFNCFTMVSYLNSHYPPIVRYYKASTDVSHFCVVKQCAGDWELKSSYSVNDPFDGTLRSLTYWESKGYVTYKLCLYRKTG